MDASLHSIAPGRKQKIYIIKYKLLNGDEKYAEMRPHRYTKNAVYLRCTRRSCKAKLSMKLLPPIFTKQIKTNYFTISDQVTEDELEDTKNYGPFDHRCKQCMASKDANGYCDITRHDNQCLLEVPTTTKVSNANI